MSHLNTVSLHRFFFDLWRNGTWIICNELFREILGSKPHLLGVIDFKENFCAIQSEVFISNWKWQYNNTFCIKVYILCDLFLLNEVHYCLMVETLGPRASQWLRNNVDRDHRPHPTSTLHNLFEYFNCASQFFVMQ